MISIWKRQDRLWHTQQCSGDSNRGKFSDLPDSASIWEIHFHHSLLSAPPRMRAVVQLVNSASVRVGGEVVSAFNLSI